MGKTYASADWHSQVHIGEKMLNWMQPDDTLYFIGDAVDRGTRGLEMLKMLLEDPRVIFIKGNHEQMLIEEFYQRQIKRSPWIIWDEDEDLTVNQLIKASKEEQDYFINAIEKMSTSMIYHSPKGHNIILEHAGYSPFDIPHRTHDPLWDRQHFQDAWGSGEEADKTYMVHGHTPVQFLRFEMGYNGITPLTKAEMATKKNWKRNNCDDDRQYRLNVIRYCDGHKFDIDMGTFFTQRGVLLDLDTFDEIYF